MAERRDDKLSDVVGGGVTDNNSALLEDRIVTTGMVKALEDVETRATAATMVARTFIMMWIDDEWMFSC